MAQQQQPQTNLDEFPAQINPATLNDPDALFAVLNGFRDRMIAQEAIITQQQGVIAGLQPQQQPQPPPPQVVQVQVPAPPQQPRDLKADSPDQYKGEIGTKARTFLQNCELYFRLRPNDFPNDGRKIHWTLLKMADRAAMWAQPISTEVLNGTVTMRATNWVAFVAAFKQAFYDPDKTRMASRHINNLRQKGAASEYANEFRELVAILGWTEESQLISKFYLGLKEHVKDDLVGHPEPANMDDFITLVTRIDNRHHQRTQEKKSFDNYAPKPHVQPRNPNTGTFTPVAPAATSSNQGSGPMDLSRTQGLLSKEEREKRMKAGTCFKCGRKGHRAATCRVKAQVAAVEEEEESGSEEDSKKKDF